VETWRRDKGRDKLYALLTAGKNDNGNPIDYENTRLHDLRLRPKVAKAISLPRRALHKRGSLEPTAVLCSPWHCRKRRMDARAKLQADRRLGSEG
jgi:hypothetical protein